MGATGVVVVINCPDLGVQCRREVCIRQEHPHHQKPDDERQPMWPHAVASGAQLESPDPRIDEPPIPVGAHNDYPGINQADRPVQTESGRILPKCLDVISSADVIRAVEKYLEYDRA